LTIDDRFLTLDYKNMGIFDKFKKSSTDSATAKPTPVSIAAKQPAKKNIAAVPAPVIADKEKSVAEKTIKKVKSIEAPKAKSAREEVIKKRPDIFGVLVKPLLTEKTSTNGALNQYVFLVKTSANKIQIAQAIEARYNVKPLKVNVMNYSGKQIRYGKSRGWTKNFRKAVLTLPEGKSISVYEAQK